MSRSIYRKALVLCATFASPDITTSCPLDELGLSVVGQHVEPGKSVLLYTITSSDGRCRRCGALDVPRTVVRRLSYTPLGWRPAILLVRARRYR